MTLAQQRSVALGCARYYLRHQGIDPLDASAEDAHSVIDDYARLYPAMVGSQWYLTATDDELGRFYRDFEAWRQKRRRQFGI